jgi:hypothetical protein
VGTQRDTANLRIIDNSGIERLNVDLSIRSKQQVHVLANDYLPEGQGGLALITPTKGSYFIANTRSYYFREDGSISSAGLLEGRNLLGFKTASVYNTFFEQDNWLRIFNTSDERVTMYIRAFDLQGNEIGSSRLALNAKSGTDLELNYNLGFNIPANSYGVVKIYPSRPGAIFAESRRVKRSSEGNHLDLVKPLPFR